MPSPSTSLLRHQASWWGWVRASERFHFFPYREEEAVEATPGRPPVRVLRPTVDVELTAGDEHWATKALVDSGAPFTLFDRAAAEALNIDHNAPDVDSRRRWHRIAGRTRKAQVEHVTLRLVEPPFDEIWWEAEVDFLMDDWDMPYGLLGQQGFLDRWVVTFNAYRQYIVIQEVPAFEAALPVDPFEEFQKLDRDWHMPT